MHVSRAIDLLRDDELAVWLGGCALRAADEGIQASVLEALGEEVKSGKGLDEALATVTTFDRRAGDFGAEIIGPLLLPILIEALKAFWNAYAAELQKKAVGTLVDLTVDEVKSIFRKRVGV